MLNITGLQPVSQLKKIENKIKSIPWGHNQRIMYKCKSVREAIFYVEKTIENGWSRTILEHQIDSKLYERLGVVLFQILIVDCLKCNQNLQNKQLKTHIILI